MDIDDLRNRACASLRLLLPQVEDPSRLVDECLSSARHSFKDEFILRLSPEAWARISLTYTTAFLDSGCDLSVGEIGAAVLRDAIHIGRMEMLAQQLAQELAQSKTQESSEPKASAPKLTIIKS